MKDLFGLEDSFSEFWAAYPKRPGNPRKPAYERYRKLLMKDNLDAATILAGTKAYAATRVGEEARYTLHAATFLNQHRFLDFAEEKKAPTAIAGFYAREGSQQLSAWDAHNLAAKGVHCPRDRNGGWHFASEWPPEGNVVAFRKSE